MTIRFRHPHTGEVFEGRLTRILPEVHSLIVQRPGAEYQTVVHIDNVVFITTPFGHKVYA